MMEIETEKIKCVISDLDRTLIHNDGIISEYSKNVIEKLISKGIMFVPASGRALNSLPEKIFEIKGIKYAITSNGVSVDDLSSKKSLISLNINPNATRNLFALLKNEKILYECFIEGQGYCPKNYYENPLIFGGASYKTEYIKRTRIPIENIEEFIINNIEKIQCIDVLLKSEEKSRLMKMIQKNIPDLYVTSGENFLLEIMNKDCGKHRGMKRFCEITGIKIEEIIAFGDGGNDTELLREAGIGIAMQNACEKAKENADYVLQETNDDDGVAKEIERLFLK